MSTTKAITIAQDFHLEMGPMTRNVLVGQTGSGKTYTARYLVERLARMAPVVVLDPPGVWWGMRLTTDGQPIKHAPPIIGGAHADIPLDPKQGPVYARWIVQARSSAIFDLAGELGVGEMRRFVTAFLDELYRLKGSDPYPMHLVLEEADEFAPQSSGAEGGDLTKCMSMVDRVCRRGRTRGIGYTLITQRPAVLNKNVMNQGEVFFAGKLTGPRDRSAMLDWFASHGTKERRAEIIDALPTLKNGVGAWYDTRVDSLTIARCMKIHTYDSMRTPDGSEAAVTLGKLDTGALTAELARMAQEAKDNDPAALRKRIAELEKAGKAGAVEGSVLAELRKEIETLKGANVKLAGEFGLAREGLEYWRKRAIEVRKIIERASSEYQATFRNDAPLDPLPKGTPSRAQSRGGEGASAKSTPTVPTPSTRSGPGYDTTGEKNLTGPEHRVLTSMSWWAAFDVDEPTTIQVAVMADYSPTTKSFLNAVGRLRSLGFLKPSARDGSLELADIWFPEGLA